MKRLFPYFKGYVKECVFSPLFKLLEALLELFVPIVMASIIDVGIANNDEGYIIRMCLVLVLLAAVGLGFSITAQYFAAKAATGFTKKLHHALFTHIQGLSFSGLDQIGTATIITRMTSDMNQVRTGVNMTLRLLLRSPFIVFGSMIMAFMIDPTCALIFVVAIPILSVVIFGIMLVCIPLYRKVQSRLDAVLGITRENLTGVRVIRAFGKENSETDSFEERNQLLTALQKKVGRISALLNPATYIIVNIAIVVLIWVGAIRVEQGLLTQGAIVALYNYLSQILIELIKLADLIITITKSVACAKRIAGILETDKKLPQKDTIPEENSNAPAVVFRNVKLQYEQAGDTSLKDIDFSVQRGETVGIIGGTGSGKTSLVHLIPRFYDATEGEVYINGVDVKEYPLEVLRHKVGIVMQKAVLFKGSIRSNLQWGDENADDKALFEALETAQAKDFVDQKDGKLDFEIEQGGKNLSGGQRQRLTIARALVRKPEILILDDSASALDFATDAALRKAIKALDYKPTTFIVSQRAASIMYADKIVVLDDGEIVGLGKHEELLKSCPVYHEIYASQFKKEDLQ